jgi:hypothetical protein
METSEKHIHRINTEDAVEQVRDIVNELEVTCSMDGVSVYEIFTLAIKIQENMIKHRYNQLYSMANVIDTPELVPSALEKIAMELERFNTNN